MGARGQPWEWLLFESAFHRQDVDDLISPIGTFPRPSFQNVGEVRQYGVELASEVSLLPPLRLSLAYTFSDFTFEDFVVNDSTNFTGNQLPGVPRHTYFGELRYQHASGAFGAVDVLTVSPFFFDDANTAKNLQYTVANLRAGFEGSLGGVRISPFLGINNLTDEEYSAFALINDVRQRFFNPLPGTNVYGGVGLTF